MRKLLGVLFILAGLAGAAYYGGWVLAIGGVVKVIDGIKATPADGGTILVGILMVCPLAELVALFFLAFFGLFLGGGLLTARTDRSSKSIFNWIKY